MYMPLNDMDNDVNDDLIQRHICFDNPDEWSITARLGQDWPDARGVYINCQDLDETPDFVVWVNEEDHLRIMCLRKGGDIFAVFEKLVRGVNAMEKQMKEQGYQFLHDEHLGYVVGCPTNLGTGMRASMHVKLINSQSSLASSISATGWASMCAESTEKRTRVSPASSTSPTGTGSASAR